MLRDLGNMIASQVTLAPQTIGTTGNSSVDGVGVDRKGYESAVFVFTNSQARAITTIPTGLTITYVVQDSEDDSTFADTAYSDTCVITNTYTLTEVDVHDMKPLERYVRGKVTYSATGGSGDFIVVSGTIVLGAPTNYPV